MTIPQIADMLRHHVNHDNDAPRLIAEEVLPILKIDLTYEEVRKLEGFRDDIAKNADDLKDIADDMSDSDDEAIRRINKIVKNLRAI